MKRDSSPLDGSEDDYNYGCPVCGGKVPEIMDVESTVFRCKDCKILYSFRDGEKVAIIGNPFTNAKLVFTKNTQNTRFVT